MSRILDKTLGFSDYFSYLCQVIYAYQKRKLALLQRSYLLMGRTLI